MSTTSRYEVDPSDPHNDQMAAAARDDLAQHVESARKTLTQAPRTAAITAIAVTLIDGTEAFPRERLASLLAVALVQLAEKPTPREGSWLVAHATRELERCGQSAEDPGYTASLIAAIAAFASYGHSGGSASVAIEQLHTLLQYRTLTPLTSDPDEWEDRTEISGSPLWQNRRDPAAFSIDAGQTWHFVDDRRPE